MVGYVRTTRNPIASLTNHGLIKLLILRELAQQNQTRAQFLVEHEIIWEPPQLGGVEVEEEDQSPSNLVGGEKETMANQN